MQSPTPISLALELSQQEGSIACVDARGIVIEKSIEIGNHLTDTVMPSIQAATESLHIAPPNLELIAISTGPGGFTGLRTSVAIAKMISLCSKAKIVAVESAIVVACASNMGDGPFCIVSGVKQNHVWFSVVQHKDNTWSCDSKHLCTEELPPLGFVKALFADTHLPQRIASSAKEYDVPIVAPAPTATSLLEIALPLHHSNLHVEPAMLSPLYPREPEAVRLWKAKNPQST